MGLFKIKNPVEYSFIQWMNNFPDSGHCGGIRGQAPNLESKSL